MFSRVFSAGISGIDACLVCVEADISGGLPQFHMVGLLSSEVKEAKERVIRALSNSGIELPARKITVNLSPAGIRKQGSGFDLPIAVSILTAMGIIREEAAAGRLFVGEMSLDGQINKVNGILPIAMKAKEEGIHSLIVPKENAFEGAVIDGIRIFGVSGLGELIRGLNEGTLTETEHISLEQELAAAYEAGNLDFLDIKGQEKAKRATEVAVAGFHNLLYIGPPGSGKSMLSKRIPSILNRLDVEECLEISKIYSVMGLLEKDTLVLGRPFRSPHHSITATALIGGNGNPRPGEITLAHKGVLFLDEAAEFKKDVIEMLRQPLEDKQIVISRLNRNVVFPADFMLVMAMNPCPCGYFPDKRCSCTMSEVNRYHNRIRGPVLDRIDVCTGTSRLAPEELEQRDGTGSVQMRERIDLARKIQEERFAGYGIRFNSQMSRSQIEQYCPLEEGDRKLLDKAYARYHMTARGYYKVLKVARTIADLEGSQMIRREHILEAIGYRNLHEI
ncbi:MAG: YifB family Mg chelatase-like AAA ATPase [Parasporobacterium sp.]|nr:YifB family Mg chelatase-like AAA ATPase [Parasporobacterium sp.]